MHKEAATCLMVGPSMAAFASTADLFYKTTRYARHVHAYDLHDIGLYSA